MNDSAPNSVGPNPLGDLLRDRLADEHVDLHALAEGALHRGRRIRRVRRAGAGLAAAAVAAAVSIGVASMSGGSGPSAVDSAAGGNDTGSVAVPGAAVPKLHPGETLHFGHGVLADVTPAHAGSTAKWFVVVSGPPHAVKVLVARGLAARLQSKYGTTLELVSRGGESGHPAKPEAKPAEVTLAGWTCGPAGDEKFTCTGPHGKSDELVWRPASTYADWSGGNTDKQADWVSSVHNGVFFAVDGPDAAAIGASLVWK